MVGRRHHRTYPGLARIARGLALLCCALLSALASAQGETQDRELRAAIVAAIGRSDSFADRFDAEVWLTDFSVRLSPYVADPGERLKLLRLVHREAAAAGVPPELVLAVIEVESLFDRYAISSAGALGLMQIMPFWIEEIGRPQDNLLDPQTNLRYGCAILKYYLKREAEDLFRALGRYNGRINDNSYQGKVLDALNKRWFR